MRVQDAGAPSSSLLELETQEACDEILQRLPSSHAKLTCEVRQHLEGINRSLAKGGQGRLQRFIHRGKLEADKNDEDDGYISDDDCIAVLFDMTPGGPKQNKKEYQVFYGNVVKVTYDQVGKRVPGPRTHLTELSGEVVCKWFDEKRDAKGNVVTHNGKRAYHLTVDNRTGFNDKVEFPNILTGVCMTLDCQHDCWLLHDDDFQYVKHHEQKFTKYHNGTPAQQKRHGEWTKDVRYGHDKLKSKVFPQLGIEL
ncbi:hypothetical protein ABBQ32_004305 [Trebouxia sp. C0010 RCD-2024]